MKDGNHFESSWNGISDVIHNIKSAMCDITTAEHLLRRGVEKMIDGLGKIDQQINEDLKNE